MKVLLLGCCLLLITVPSLLAQESSGSSGRDATPDSQVAAETEGRAELWRRKRIEKKGRITPEQNSRPERLLLWLEKELLEAQEAPGVAGIEKLVGLEGSGMFGLSALDWRDRIYPRGGSMRSGSGWGSGFTYWEPRLLSSPLDLEFTAQATYNRYQFYNIRVGKLRARPKVDVIESDRLADWFLYSDVRYSYFPQEDFFGLGPDSRRSDRSDFLLERTAYNVVTGLRFDSHLTAAVRAGVSQFNIGAGGDAAYTNTHVLFNEANTPGLSEQPNFFEFASSIQLDYRDVPSNPHRGVLAALRYERFDDLKQNRYQFQRVVIDGRGYLPLGSPQRVLALQFLTSLSDTGAGAEVPFYLQHTLGGKNTLRGFRDFRFRDRNFLHLSAEYRWEAATMFELAFFYDTGKVFSKASDFALDGLRQSVGGGLRFKTPQATFLRLDLARSGEGMKLYFTFGHPF